jgi:hypothetical protein
MDQSFPRLFSEHALEAHLEGGLSLPRVLAIRAAGRRALYPRP